MRRILVVMVIFVGLAVGVGVSADTGALPAPLVTDGSNYTWQGAVDLQVSPSPWGAGYIRSTTRYVDCPYACIRPYDKGAVVTLEAFPSAHYTFTGWQVASHGLPETAGVCPGTELCTVTLDQAKDVVAVFKGDATTELDRNLPGPKDPGRGKCDEDGCTLTVTVNAENEGNSVRDGDALDCEADGQTPTKVCTQTYPQGTVVSLGAFTDGGTFDGWGGDCSGNGGCSVTMNKPHSVSASFSSGG